jgi:outer membrane protein, heavy metal efflux system
MTGRAFLCAAGLVLLVPAAEAQQLTVEQLVAIAIERAPELRAVRADIAVAAGQVLQAGLRPNPILAATQEQGARAMMTTTAGIEWPLDLFRRPSRVATAERAAEVASLSVRDRERLLAAAVREQAGRLLAARRMVDVRNEALAAARRMRDLLDRRVTEGGAPKLEANVAAVEALRIEADAALAAGEAEAASIELKALAGLEADAPLVVTDSLESVVRASPGDAAPAAAAITARPDVREAAARIAQATARVEEARQGGRIDLTMTGGYTRMRFGFEQLGLDEHGALVPIEDTFHAVSIGARVALPWLHRNQGVLASAQAERTRAEAALDARQRAARAELEAATVRDREARRAVELYASTVRDLARQNVDVMLEAYDLGRFPLSDLLLEQRRYVEVEAAYTEVLARAYQARAALRRALGATP